MLMQRLADYAANEQKSVLSPDVIHHAKRAFVDWYAAVLPGSIVAPATLLEAALAEELDCGHARLASGRRATMHAAALINGAASHTVEVDDIFRDAVYHPGSPTISAALAVAQAHDASGERLLRGVIVGYEISTRIGATIVKGHYRYWHTTGTAGCFGAAAAAATVLGLDRDQTMHALATVATFASGLQQAFRSESMTKPLHSGHAAEVGVMSALGAQRGLIGALDILEGPAGFGAAMGGNPDWTTALGGLGDQYNITRVTFKNHCCCGHTFAPLDAALSLRTRHKLAADMIKRVTIYTYQTALEVTGTYRASVPSEARFSLPYVVARALQYGSVRLNAFTVEALKDTKVKELMKRIEFKVDPEFNSLFPGRRSARVEIELIDGRIVKHDQMTRKGDPDAPLSDDELTEKYFELVEPVIGKHAGEELLQAIWSLDKVSTAHLVARQPGPRVAG